MSFDVNITVNGNRCKQYQFQGNTFIQANEGSEYVIELKNNYYKRILSVCSVDGLNVLSGKSASDTDTGYIVNSHSSEKIKGFRFSDDEWALFKFGFKLNGKTYAQSKKDGSEKNCGVIGVKFFYEQETYCAPNVSIWNNYPSWPDIYKDTGTPVYPIWYSTCGNTTSDWDGTVTCNDLQDNVLYEKGLTSNTVGMSSGNTAGLSGRGSSDKAFLNSSQQYSTPIKSETFDMGTQFGRAEKSKVKTVEFERGYLAKTFNIYYASRQSLIDMGVPITTGLQVNLPKSFPGTYCEPPKGWQG